MARHRVITIQIETYPGDDRRSESIVEQIWDAIDKDFETQRYLGPVHSISVGSARAASARHRVICESGLSAPTVGRLTKLRALLDGPA